MNRKRIFVYGLLVALALASVATAQEPDHRGIVLVSSRIQAFEGHQGDPPEGCTPGDVAMLLLLQNAGYRGKIAFDTFLESEFIEADARGDYVEIVIISGSSSSSNVQKVEDGVPAMMGEHVTLANPERAGYIGFYGDGADTGDRNRWGSDTEGLTQYMKIIDKEHPITVGIETDENGLVKILREPYPTEDQFNGLPEGADTSQLEYKPNYEFAWPEANVSAAAPGTHVLAVNPLDETKSIFAVVEEGGELADGSTATARLIHYFVNENGSGGTQRRFMALNSTGRLLFLRAAQWAMGDPLTEPGSTIVDMWDLY